MIAIGCVNYVQISGVTVKMDLLKAIDGHNFGAAIHVQLKMFFRS